MAATTKQEAEIIVDPDVPQVRIVREFHRCEIDHYVLVDSIEAM